jgi:urease accessory protein
MIEQQTAYRVGPPAVLGGAMLTADRAVAHPLMGGRAPSTFVEGLLSGLGDPVIDIDHLAFLAAVGVVAGVAGLNLLLPVVFVAASALGVSLHLQGLDIPGAELMVATSVILAGALVARGVDSSAGLWAALFAAGGLVQGYVFANSISDAETTPLAGYLIGLVVMQSAIAIIIAVMTRRQGIGAMATRLAGATIACVGLAVLVQQFMPFG